MSLRLFADHCVPTAVCQALRKAGHEVLLLRENMPSESEDVQVLTRAQDLKCILLSLNGDFADVLAYPPHKYGGIISLELRNQPVVISRLTATLIDYLNAHPEMEHFRSRLFRVGPHRIRVRE